MDFLLGLTVRVQFCAGVTAGCRVTPMDPASVDKIRRLLLVTYLVVAFRPRTTYSTLLLLLWFITHAFSPLTLLVGWQEG